MIGKSIQILKGLRHPNGLFSASHLTVSTGYNRAWIRDNIYEAMGLEAVDPNLAVPTYHTLLDIFLKYESKIDWAIKEKPKYSYQYIHARYDPNTLEEIYEEWGNKQNDAVGLFLFKVADLMDHDVKVLRNDNDKRIIQKLIAYLKSIEYWHDKDNGIWEESEEVHASSVGACAAGLKRISRYFSVEEELIEKGRQTLNNLLPRESETKEVDLALLTLIYPLKIITRQQAELILKNVEEKLLKEKGVLRYTGDQYYNKDGEAEWCFGLPWLAIIYKRFGNFVKYRYFMQKTLSAMTDNGELPELYYSNSRQYNENTPLGWGQALVIAAVN